MKKEVSGHESFVRSVGMEQLGLDPSRLIGTKVELAFEIRDEKPVFFRLERELLPKNPGKGKPIHIWQHTGRRPIPAFGNSRGDQAMFEYTDTNPSPNLILYLMHDDPEREYSYDSRLKHRPHW